MKHDLVQFILPFFSRGKEKKQKKNVFTTATAKKKKKVKKEREKIVKYCRDAKIMTETPVVVSKYEKKQVFFLLMLLL